MTPIFTGQGASNRPWGAYIFSAHLLTQNNSAILAVPPRWHPDTPPLADWMKPDHPPRGLTSNPAPTCAAHYCAGWSWSVRWASTGASAPGQATAALFNLRLFHCFDVADIRPMLVWFTMAGVGTRCRYSGNPVLVVPQRAARSGQARGSLPSPPKYKTLDRRNTTQQRNTLRSWRSAGRGEAQICLFAGFFCVFLILRENCEFFVFFFVLRFFLGSILHSPTPRCWAPRC